MNSLAAAVLLHLGGKPVDESGIKAVLTAAGSKVDEKVVSNVVKALKGKDVLKFAKDNLGNVGAVSSGSTAPETKVEAKKDDKKGAEKKDDKKDTKKKQEVVEDDDMPMGLF